MKGVIVNEILANPVGSDQAGEFIELLNRDNQEVDLTGFKLTDKAGKEFIFKHRKIAPGEIIVLGYQETKININNSGEIITWWQGDKKLETIEVPIAKEGWSWSRQGENWYLTQEPTPGKENVFTEAIKETAGVRENLGAGSKIALNSRLELISLEVVTSLALALVAGWLVHKIKSDEIKI